MRNVIIKRAYSQILSKESETYHSKTGISINTLYRRSDRVKKQGGLSATTSKTADNGSTHGQIPNRAGNLSVK